MAALNMLDISEDVTPRALIRLILDVQVDIATQVNDKATFR